ncbi:YkgJ family cysteine cluster protein [Halosimplex salinum]|uniref:YkgJ family cysteine cluster protein n=1 Tax=Halosimplex salinum TaxID=1710538 RepID=UPI000F48EA1C|nr:YkgJ family cysteine cluster protein [Halosimplex salinum]
MPNSDVGAVSVCATECGAACCQDGAFLRPADVDTLEQCGVSEAIHECGRRTRVDEDGSCTLLADDNHCRIYEDRPLDCRLFPVGFELDDRREVVHIVLVGCPLTEVLDEETLAEYVESARAALSEFTAASLRAYDDLLFTDEYERIATVEYDTIEINL